MVQNLVEGTTTGIVAEKLVVQILKGILPIGRSKELVCEFSKEVVKDIQENELTVDIQYVSALNNVRGFKRIIKDDIWKQSCLFSAQVIGETFLQELGASNKVSVIHNKASQNSLIQYLSKEVAPLVRKTITGALDRWNPADIWIVKDPSVLKKLPKDFSSDIPEEERLKVITDFFNEQYKGGKLIGISLKKVRLGSRPVLVPVEPEVIGDIEGGSEKLVFVGEEISVSGSSGTIKCKCTTDSSYDGMLKYFAHDRRFKYILDSNPQAFLGSSSKRIDVDKDATVEDILKTLQENDAVLTDIITHAISHYTVKINNTTLTSANHFRIQCESN